jgi:hypothetical protein
MQIDYRNKTIFCYSCNKDYTIHQVFEHLYYEGSITCFQDHLIGNTWDKEYIYLTSPCPYLMLEHNKLRCRCVDEETNCEGIDENCNFILGKKSYEDDKNEEKKL